MFRFVLLSLSLLLTLAHATHLRYANIWARKKVGENRTVVVDFEWAGRYQSNYLTKYPGKIYNIENIFLQWGDNIKQYRDGSSTKQGIVMDFVSQTGSYEDDSSKDWFLGRQTVEHTFPETGVYYITYDKTNRYSLLAGGNAGIDLPMKLICKVNLDVPDLVNPRVYSMPVVPMYLNELNVYDQIVEYHRDDWQYAIPTSQQSGLIKTIPEGLILTKRGDSKSLRYEWTPTEVGLYAFAVVVKSKDNKSRTPVDFIFEVKERGTSQPPSVPVITGYPQPSSIHGIFSINVHMETQFSTTIVTESTSSDTVGLTYSAPPTGMSISDCTEGVDPLTLQSRNSTCSKMVTFTPTGEGVSSLSVLSHDGDGAQSPLVTVQFNILPPLPTIDTATVKQDPRQILAIHGEHFLGTSNDLQVQVGDVSCNVTRHNMTYIECEPGAIVQAQERVVVTVSGFASESREIAVTFIRIGRTENGQLMVCKETGCFYVGDDYFLHFQKDTTVADIFDMISWLDVSSQLLLSNGDYVLVNEYGDFVYHKGNTAYTSNFCKHW